jgi:hypothetical protein
MIEYLFILRISPDGMHFTVTLPPEACTLVQLQAGMSTIRPSAATKVTPKLPSVSARAHILLIEIIPEVKL